MARPTRSDKVRLDEYGRPVRRKSILLRIFVTLLVLGIVFGAVGAGALVWFLADQGRAPREWAPYLERRASGHQSILVDATALVADYLNGVDRIPNRQAVEPPPNIGASPDRSGQQPRGRPIAIASQADLRAAVAAAQPGDILTILPGRYVFNDRQIGIARPGTAANPITVRATRLGTVSIEAQQGVVFKVQAPFWRFENLAIRGACADHTDCEHVFHIVGDARGTVIRNNRLEDMNAYIKINGEGGQFPDDGVVEGNTLTMTKPRATRNPITPVDLVAANNWRISDNFIADFLRVDPDKPTYGAFVKGAGEKNTIERNVVLCEWKLRSAAPAVGLSLGGGGTDVALTRDRGRSGLEQSSGAIRDNLIAFCNDVGIYVNKSSRSIVEHNTLLDTAGIDVRFPESSAELAANLIDGRMGARDGGTIRDRGNGVGSLLGLFVGSHPVRDLYRDPANLDLVWVTRPLTPGVAKDRPDLCGQARPATPLAGAFQDYGPCT